MRVLFLVPDLFGPPGGIARYCGLVTRALCESASLDRLDVLAFWDPEGADIDPRYLFGERFTYRAFGGRRLAFASAAAGLMRRRRYDLLISGHVGFGPLLFAPAGGQHGMRRVSFIYGVDAWVRLPWHKRLALRSSDMVISISQYTADRAAAANDLPTDRLRLLYNCLDPSLEGDHVGQVLPAAHAQSPALGGRRIVTISRLAKGEDKGHTAILRALPTVLARVADLQYVIVGDGERRAELEALAAALGVAHRTHFLGTLSDAEVGHVLSSSDAFVMPSRNEGFGFVFLEAMAQGVPVIAGVHDAAPEVLGPQGGLVVDADNVPEVAAAVIQVLSDPDLRGRLVQGGQQRLDKLFRYPRFRRTLLSHLSGDPPASADDEIVE